MDQQQPNEAQESQLAKTIININNHFENINNQIKDEFPQIPQKSTVLIFLGEFGQQFLNFYAHFETQQVIQVNKYYNLVQVEDQGKIYYLLNFPMILLYDDQNNEIAQNLCISKIYAEMALKQMEKCSFNLILDNQQIKGDDDLAKLDNVIEDSIFYFGSYYFNVDNFFLLRNQVENRWDYLQFSKSNGFFSYFSQKQQIQTQNVGQNEILNSIIKSGNIINVTKVKSQDFINYGKMMTYLQKQYDALKEQLNLNILQFQKLLLYLQQMPIINNNSEVLKEVEDYLKELYKNFEDKRNLLTDKASQIGSVYKYINKVNKQVNACMINKRQEKVFSPQMKQFKEDNKIEQLKIKPLLSDDLNVKLNSIIQFFVQYLITIIKNDTICEVQKLKLNLKQWCAYCHESLENTLYELKYITQRIQKGPKKEIENGIYFIGITKAGKSTIINSLLNPHKIVQEEFLGQKCYRIKIETKFEIGEGGVSETQKISGVYIGKKEELNQFFDQDESNVFSLEEVLDQNQNQNCKIPQKCFIFDCPGFDDNSNELMRIAHRISLYNYFSKTKNIIVFFVVDISQQNNDQIKNTFDPISYLLENKKDLEQDFDKWTNLILTKAKDGSRQKYLESWEKVYKGYLEQDYSFYKKLFENDERCIEFPKPSKDITKNIKNLVDSIPQKLQNQLEQQKKQQQNEQQQSKQQQNQQQQNEQQQNEQQSSKKEQSKFKLVLDDKVWRLYEQCIPKAKMKLEQLINFLIEDLDQYILESDDTINQKKEQMQKIQNILLNQIIQDTKIKQDIKKTQDIQIIQDIKKTQDIQIIQDIKITQENCEQILKGISDWVKGNHHLKHNDFFLQLYIEDMKSILTISKYCQNNNIAPFEIKIDHLVNKIKTILKMIEQTIQYYKNLKYTGYATTFIAGIATCGTSLALLEVGVLANLARQFLLTRGALWVATVSSGSLTASTSGLSVVLNFIESWKNTHLKKIYQTELEKQQQQEQQQREQQQLLQQQKQQNA
ncbi:unnamed protein product [Paramecium pentaurelia]|uniref:Uncharacterized protein n=1 Tax=Paramecium pentaurelia TaxID=43138 RepID=A0A8S1WDZ6_9CILI|nr:unnamed protein product [Paramecium pentaurelia]